jgi:hypothetical protein
MVQLGEALLMLVSVGTDGVVLTSYNYSTGEATHLLKADVGLTSWSALYVHIHPTRLRIFINSTIVAAAATTWQKRYVIIDSIGGTQRPSRLGTGYAGMIDMLNVLEYDLDLLAPNDYISSLVSSLGYIFANDIDCEAIYEPKSVRIVAGVPALVAPPVVSSLQDVSVEQQFEYALVTAAFATNVTFRPDGGLSLYWKMPGNYSLTTSQVGLRDSRCQAEPVLMVQVYPALRVIPHGFSLVTATAESFLVYSTSYTITGGLGGDLDVLLPDISEATLASSITCQVVKEGRLCSVQVSGLYFLAGNYTSIATVVEPSSGASALLTEINLVVSPPLVQSGQMDRLTALSQHSIQPPPFDGGSRGDDATYTYKLGAGAELPVGLYLDNATGYIAGAPVEAGTVAVQLVVEDANGADLPWIVTLDIAPELGASLMRPSLPSTLQSLERFEQQLDIEVEGGWSPYSLTLVNEPDGLDINNTGFISGVASVPGVFNVSIVLTDAVGARVAVTTWAVQVQEPSLSSSNAEYQWVVYVSVAALVCVVCLAILRYRTRRTPYDFSSKIAEIIASDMFQNGKRTFDAVTPVELPAKSLQVLGTLGGGIGGLVSKAIFEPRRAKVALSPDYPVAVKQIKLDATDPAVFESALLTEAAIMAQFDHPNVLALIGVVTLTRPIMAVTSFCEYGCLTDFLVWRRRSHPIDQQRKLKICADIASGANYLHGLGFVHRGRVARYPQRELLTWLHRFGGTQHSCFRRLAVSNCRFWNDSSLD